MLTRRTVLACALLCMFAVGVSPLGQVVADQSPLRDLDSHCPFTPPTDLGAWDLRAKDLKLQLEVSQLNKRRATLRPTARVGGFRLSVEGEDNNSLKLRTLQCALSLVHWQIVPLHVIGDTTVPAVILGIILGRKTPPSPQEHAAIP